ncbi:MAG TPA: hypothetical protein VKX17_15330 [Planctomycetota bacterium]|nr:hypothetical protein [Planctomycetota bacterium]
MEEARPDEIDEPRTRPTGVSVIAVLAIVFGILGVCCAPFVIGQLVIAGDPVHVAMRNNTGLYIYMLGTQSFHWIISIALTAIGFGLWRLSEWARKGAVALAIFTILYQLANTAVYYLLFGSQMMDLMGSSSGQPVSPEIMKTITYIVTPICMCFVFGIYVWIAVYLTRPHVKAAFQTK